MRKRIVASGCEGKVRRRKTSKDIEYELYVERDTYKLTKKCQRAMVNDLEVSDMEKENQKFWIDSILDIALSAVVLINALVGRFVTNALYPIALRGVFKVLFWGILAVATGLLLRRFFKNALGKAKGKMILSLIALFIVGVILVIAFSIDESQMVAEIATGPLVMIDRLNLSFRWIAVLLVALLLLGGIGLSVLLIKEPSTKSGFLGILYAVGLSYLIALAFWSIGAFFLLLILYILIILIVKAVTRKKTENTSGIQHRSSNLSNYSYTVQATERTKKTTEKSKEINQQNNKELDEYNTYLKRLKNDIRIKKDQRRGYADSLAKADKNGGKLGLYDSDFYRQQMEACDYALRDLENLKREYERRIRRIKEH